jgi:hypothetical protein
LVIPIPETRKRITESPANPSAKNTFRVTTTRNKRKAQIKIIPVLEFNKKTVAAINAALDIFPCAQNRFLIEIPTRRRTPAVKKVS